VFRFLVLLFVGVAIGYNMGFRDARKHKQPVQERVLERIGGSTRGKYNQDIDRQIESAERP
jgi:hypothetical protein